MRHYIEENETADRWTISPEGLHVEGCPFTFTP